MAMKRVVSQVITAVIVAALIACAVLSGCWMVADFDKDIHEMDQTK